MKGLSTALDFISDDLIITNIHTVYWAEVTNWSKPKPEPRYANGLVLVSSGRIDYVFGQEHITGARGDVLFFPKDIPYAGVKYGDEPNSYFVLDFDTVRDDDCVRFPLPLSFPATDLLKLEKAFRSLLLHWHHIDATARLKCRSDIYALLALVIDDYLKIKQSGRDLGIFPEIASYIGRHFTDPHLNVKRICEQFYLSESLLRRMFHKTLAQSPLSYIQSLRFELALNLLSGDSGHASIAEIAHACGFTSLAYFSRTIKKKTGLSPREVRKTLLEPNLSQREGVNSLEPYSGWR